MIRRFSIELLNPDGTFQTHTVNDAKNILIHAEKETYEYEEITEIVDKAYYLKKRTLFVGSDDVKLKPISPDEIEKIRTKHAIIIASDGKLRYAELPNFGEVEITCHDKKVKQVKEIQATKF